MNLNFDPVPPSPNFNVEFKARIAIFDNISNIEVGGKGPELKVYNLLSKIVNKYHFNKLTVHLKV